MPERKRAPLIGLCEATKRYGAENVTFVRPQYVPVGCCEWCGRLIENSRRKQFCSEECSLKFGMATSSVYYANQGSRGGYGNHILRRDNYTCQRCGEFHGKQNEHGVLLPTTDGELEIHHIVRVCDGGSDAPGNLTTLCKKCHKEIHNAAAGKGE
ncbi:hypothetical protein SDC9_74203 [bioreactor metagenome]|uniref:HNH nuclease domain-containing protein n=1 Tax=bioreactor metagenome TaxID=1076179 RepID=A0A644YGW1_9ZZZZ